MRKVVEEFFFKHDKDPVCRYHTLNYTTTRTTVRSIPILYGDYGIIILFRWGW